MYLDTVQLGPSHEIDPLSSDLRVQVYLVTGIPRMAKRAANLNTNGVGLLRNNFILQETGQHPYSFVESNETDRLESTLTRGIATIAEAFDGKPVWVRTMDFATSDLREFPGGGIEPDESNPMLGWRGLVRGLDQTELLRSELRALRTVVGDLGHTNVGVIFPLVRSVQEYQRAKSIMAECGLRPHRYIKVGSMIETPSAAIQIDEFISDGLDLAFVGINDLTQYTLASDRENTRMQRSYDPSHMAVRFLADRVFQRCKQFNVDNTISIAKPMISDLREYVRAGLRSVSVMPSMLGLVSRELSIAANNCEQP